MYRRGFSVNTLRYRAQNLINRARRQRNPVVWAVGAGCLLIVLCVLCVGAVGVGVYLLTQPVATSGLLTPLALLAA
jgi:hypothetical protein